MAYSLEQKLVDELADKWSKEKKQVVKELTIPIIHQIFYNNYLENREYVRIDLAVYDEETDEMVFVEAENGLFLQHPQIYLPFCNKLFILCPRDTSSFRNEQVEWSRSRGIGIIERTNPGDFDISLNPLTRSIFPAVSAYVKARFFRKIEKERRKNVKTTN